MPESRVIATAKTARLHAMARDAANESPYLVQLFEDISARKKAEAQIERLRRARDVMAACHRILVHATDESAMLRAMCSVAVESGGYKQAWIGLVTGDVKRPVSVVACALPTVRLGRVEQSVMRAE